MIVCIRNALPTHYDKARCRAPHARQHTLQYPVQVPGPSCGKIADLSYDICTMLPMVVTFANCSFPHISWYKIQVITKPYQSSIS